MIAAIILAAGKGTRLKSKKFNKVVLPFAGKPMINYGIDLFTGIADRISIVVGAFSHSVMTVVNGEKKIVWATQKKRLGTAHAAYVGALALKKFSPQLAFVGYGDHLMFYKKSTLKKLVQLHKKEEATISLITTSYKDPDVLAWGHVIRDKRGHVVDIVEHKDADKKQKAIHELNAGLYCFDFDFLLSNIKKVKKSQVTGEYYINEFIRVAASQGKKVIGVEVPFEEVGIGVNRTSELEDSQVFYNKLHQ